jgi:uncharacterized membrane protein required for colicin V production
MHKPTENIRTVCGLTIQIQPMVQKFNVYSISALIVEISLNSLSRLLMCLLSFLQPNVQVNIMRIGEVSQKQAGLMFPVVHSGSNTLQR